MPGIKQFFERIMGQEKPEEKKEEKELTKAEKKQIKEGKETIDELESSMNVEKIAKEAMKSDKDLRPEEEKKE